jgi:hypothetical protein
MKHHRTILGTVPLLVGIYALIGPSGALASGPLLSGYGGPGAGSQAIIGAALLNGPSGGSGSSSSGGGSVGSSGSGSAGSSGGASGAATTAGGGSTHAGATTNGGGSARGANTGSSGRGNHPAGGGSGQAAGGGTGSAGVQRTSVRAGTSIAASIDGGASWFSGADLLSLLLAAGALVLTAVATVRLARHHP